MITRTVVFAFALVFTITSLARSQDLPPAGTKPAPIQIIDFRQNPYTEQARRAEWLALAAYKALLDAIQTGKPESIQEAARELGQKYHQMMTLKALDARFEKEFGRMALFGLARPTDSPVRPPLPWVAGAVTLEARFEPGHEIILAGQRLPLEMRKTFDTRAERLVLVRHIPGAGTKVAHGRAQGWEFAPETLQFSGSPTGEPLTVVLHAVRGARVFGMVRGIRPDVERTHDATPLDGALIRLTSIKTGTVYQATSASVQAAGSAPHPTPDADARIMKPAPSNFWLRGLPVGAYRVHVSRDGYLPHAPAEPLKITAFEQRLRLDVELTARARDVERPVSVSHESADAEAPVAGPAGAE